MELKNGYNYSCFILLFLLCFLKKVLIYGNGIIRWSVLKRFQFYFNKKMKNVCCNSHFILDFCRDNFTVCQLLRKIICNFLINLI